MRSIEDSSPTTHLTQAPDQIWFSPTAPRLTWARFDQVGLEPRTQPLMRRRFALSYFCTACGFAPRLKHKPPVYWVVFVALKAVDSNSQLQRCESRLEIADFYCELKLRCSVASLSTPENLRGWWAMNQLYWILPINSKWKCFYVYDYVACKKGWRITACTALIFAT